MKYLLIISILFASKLNANDSLALVQLNKAKNYAICGAMLGTMGIMSTHYGVTNNDKQMSSIGYTMIIGASILGTISIYHYSLGNMMLSMSASELKVSIQIR